MVRLYCLRISHCVCKTFNISFVGNHSLLSAQRKIVYNGSDTQNSLYTLRDNTIEERKTINMINEYCDKKNYIKTKRDIVSFLQQKQKEILDWS